MVFPARPCRARRPFSGAALLPLLLLLGPAPALASTVEVHYPTIYTSWSTSDVGASTAGFSILDEEVHVLNGQSGVVTVYDLHGRLRRTWDSGLSGYGNRGLNLLAQHSFARAMRSTLGDEMLVADPDHGRVLRPQRGPEYAISGDKDGLIQFVRPVGVVQGNYGLRILDAGLGKVITLNSDLTLGPVWSATGTDGAPVELIGITEDEHGRVFVADAGTGRIHGFTETGAYIWSMGGSGASDGGFVRLGGLAALGGGLAALDIATNRVQFINFQGEHLLTWGDGGDPAYQIDESVGISYSPNNNIYVVDPGHHRIVAYDIRTPAEPFRAQITNSPVTTNGVEPLLVLYKADATGGWQPYHYEWDFGDGSPPEGGQTLQHRYQKAGTYAVTLTVTDAGDPRNHAQADRNVTVRLPDGNPPRLVLHLQPAGNVLDPCSPPALNAVNQAVVSADLSATSDSDYYIYLVVDRNEIPSVAGLQCGLTYGDGSASAHNDGVGVDILEWHLCADLEFPMEGVNPWPGAASGNLITWDSTTHCQTGPMAVAGYFVARAYSQDQLKILPRPADALASVADCTSHEYYLGANQLGVVAFSPGAELKGYNPSLPGGSGSSTPVRPSTWSAIKILYGTR